MKKFSEVTSGESFNIMEFLEVVREAGLEDMSEHMIEDIEKTITSKADKPAATERAFAEIYLTGLCLIEYAPAKLPDMLSFIEATGGREALRREADELLEQSATLSLYDTIKASTDMTVRHYNKALADMPTTSWN